MPASATVTDTLNALAGFDALADPNSIRGLLVSTVLTPGVTLLSASCKWPCGPATNPLLQPTRQRR
ncbi:MAG: hypothetical protein HC853_12240 [Anaerolineae bacterium]|nr:hypothetical protein [Anaerolineae bacterium]